MARCQEEASLVEQQEVAKSTFRLRLRCEPIASMARPGQFLMLQVRSGNEPLLKRPFSFHRINPREGLIEVLYRVVGQGTWWLSQCPPGTRLNAVGPLGNGFSLPNGEHRMVALVAGGIGIAPFHELMAQLCSNSPENHYHHLHLFYGARTATELVPTHQYESMGISVHCCTDDGSFGYQGFVTQLFGSHAGSDRLRPDLVYSCGPLIMQYHMAKWALAEDVPAQLSLESLMACGIGACLGCALPSPHPRDPGDDHYLHVCKDGPIFQPGSIAWTKLQRQATTPRISLYS